MPPTWKCSDKCSLVFDTNRRCEFHRKTCPHFLEQLGTSSHYLGSDRQSENDGSSMGLTSELALYQLKRRRTDILNQAAKRRLVTPSPNTTSGQTDTLNQHNLTVDLDGHPTNPPPPPSPPPPPAPPPPPVLSAAGRAVRPRRLPARYIDQPPEPPIALPDPTPLNPLSSFRRRVTLIVRDTYSTAANIFGLWRKFPYRPSFDPDSLIGSEHLSNIRQPRDTTSEGNVLSTLMTDKPPPLSQQANPVASYSPFTSKTIALLMNWANNGFTNKSEEQVDELVHDVLRHQDFEIPQLDGFSAHRENKRLDEANRRQASHSNPVSEGPTIRHPLFDAGQFHETSVTINVPTGEADGGRKVEIPGLHHRKLIDLITAAFSTDKFANRLHYSPFQLFHRSPLTNEDQRVYSELYNSDAFLEEDDKVKRYAPTDDPNCTLEKVVAALMHWSDTTHLADFGTAKLWPIYLILGNLSKYIGALPDSGACHHVAYIPSLSDSFQDAVSRWHKKWHTQGKEILTHCRRELMHAVWKELLDDDFLHAYKYGLVVKCPDGISRRIYPRFFTYSADYPEKVLLATIRDKGLCPCTRCLTPKSKLHLMGQVYDMAFRVQAGVRKYLSRAVTVARKYIYDAGYSVASTAIDNLLKETSSVPTVNAFIDRLGEDFNLHRMLTVDFMHEYNLGVWKAVFTHLVRLVYAQRNGNDKIAELDRRYRLIPRFGKDTIRRFADNPSEMKNLAARDFEDLLLCAIPAFEGLFDLEEDNLLVGKLLFKMAEWHALAKLRMHTEKTLKCLEHATTKLGKIMRQFANVTCTRTETYELPRERAARERRQAQQNKNLASSSTSTRKRKTINLNTYKWHVLGDYVRSIHLFGPVDIYSTQIGELAHRFVKRLYRLSSKFNAAKQISKQFMRTAYVRQTYHQQNPQTKPASRKRHRHLAAGRDPTGYLPPDQHHFISHSRNHPIRLSDFIHDNQHDPAFKDFRSKLHDHILGQLTRREFDGDDHNDFTDADRNSLRIADVRIFSVSRFQVNYTTYDVRRDQDSLNPSRQCNVMVNSPETAAGAHPFWYAQVLGVFHTSASVFPSRESTLRPISSTPIQFLWVRWYGIEPGNRSGFRHSRLPKIGFVPQDDKFAFGFLDPSVVIRGCHLIPAFAMGKTGRLLRAGISTVARKPGQRKDWVNYYVGMFADCDMAMRFTDMGIGHQMARDGRNSSGGEDEWEDVINEDDTDDTEPEDRDSDSGDDSDKGASNNDSEYCITSLKHYHQIGPGHLRLCHRVPNTPRLLIRSLLLPVCRYLAVIRANLHAYDL
ncbi:hypothetical protein QCA50_012552 [Cerrena zonata]|uniref:C2H2-type domain-containing protein n=1 Tax=Cerrena zonata TaxID=2478898 RepID=A0AAW0G2T1_9APHY